MLDLPWPALPEVVRAERPSRNRAGVGFPFRGEGRGVGQRDRDHDSSTKNEICRGSGVVESRCLFCLDLDIYRAGYALSAVSNRKSKECGEAERRESIMHVITRYD